jgi:hypothetical protein
MKQQSASQRNPRNTCHKVETKPGFAPLFQPPLTTPLRACATRLRLIDNEGTLFLTSTSQKEMKCAVTLNCGSILIAIGVVWCVLLSPQANAQVIYDCGSEAAIVRGTADGGAGKCQGVSQLLNDPRLSKLPDAPSAASRGLTNNGLVSGTQSGLEVRDFAIEAYSGKKPQTVDREFLVLNGLLVIAAIADAESTLRCNPDRCRELNPILGSHPTRRGVYSLGVPLTAFEIFLAYHYKRLSPTRNGWKNGWKTFPIAFAAIHGFATANNLLVSQHGQ